ncbi:tetratricopeptide repeat protein [Chitinophaga arvensicola]|uniref:Tetratricopeptide repeat-containing protein n=1 Tax=Chitinophaga arvensicola TaxID=29529 RepID=A0A1I0SDA7_9BACT|nr:hypothetical protein [Chitinophaga arvensicola]SEW53938.1 hypothetical protein SAMN04488122_5778 [Chitinophaga arvensicola]
MTERLKNKDPKDLPVLLRQLKDADSTPDFLTKEDLIYLEMLKSTPLKKKEQAGVYFLLGYGYTRIKEQRLAVHYFDLAFTLADDYFPQPKILTKAYLQVLHGVVSQTSEVALVNHCREWSERFNFPVQDAFADLAAVYYLVKDYDAAATLWGQQLEKAPGCVNTCHLLIDTLYHHLQRYEAAISIYKRVPESVRQVPFIQLLAGHCYKATGAYGAAEQLYKAAISATHPVNTLPMLALAELYADSLADDPAADQWYQRATEEKGSSYELLQAKISYLCFLVARQRHTAAVSLLLFMEQQLNDNFNYLPAAVLNRVAWRLYVLNTRLDLAEQFARRATTLDANDAGYAFTLLAILICLKKWEELAPYVARWLKLSEDAVIKRDWPHYSLVFREVIAQERQTDFDVLLNDQLSDCWLMIRYALYKTTTEGMRLQIPMNIYDQVESIYQQFICPDVPVIFPE